MPSSRKGSISKEEEKELEDLLAEEELENRFSRINSYDPYPYQKKFHKSGSEANQRLLMAANRIGKSYCGSMELSYHLTGIYPDWWEGREYDHPIVAWAGGVSNETTRDIVQFELLGSPDDPDAFGSGTIPKNYIIKTERKPGVPNAKSVALIRHISGGNSSFLQSLRDGCRKMAGQVSRLYLVG